MIRSMVLYISYEDLVLDYKSEIIAYLNVTRVYDYMSK